MHDIRPWFTAIELVSWYKIVVYISKDATWNCEGMVSTIY